MNKVNQYEQIAALTNETNSLKRLVESKVMGIKNNNREYEIFEIDYSGKHCGPETKMKTTKKIEKTNCSSALWVTIIVKIINNK